MFLTVNFNCHLQLNLIAISERGAPQRYTELVAPICHAVLLTWHVRASVGSAYFSCTLADIALVMQNNILSESAAEIAVK